MAKAAMTIEWQGVFPAAPTPGLGSDTSFDAGPTQAAPLRLFDEGMGGMAMLGTAAPRLSSMKAIFVKPDRRSQSSHNGVKNDATDSCDAF